MVTKHNGVAYMAGRMTPIHKEAAHRNLMVPAGIALGLVVPSIGMLFILLPLPFILKSNPGLALTEVGTFLFLLTYGLMLVYLLLYTVASIWMVLAGTHCDSLPSRRRRWLLVSMSLTFPSMYFVTILLTTGREPPIPMLAAAAFPPLIALLGPRVASRASLLAAAAAPVFGVQGLGFLLAGRRREGILVLAAGLALVTTAVWSLVALLPSRGWLYVAFIGDTLPFVLLNLVTPLYFGLWLWGVLALQDWPDQVSSDRKRRPARTEKANGSVPVQDHTWTSIVMDEPSQVDD